MADLVADVVWALELLRDRLHTVIWAPGNHELGTLPNDPTTLRGEARYRHLVEQCRRIGVLTPEDAYAHETGIVLVNHWPLVCEPTRVLRYPQFAQWCGTELTADWHRRFTTAAMVYGHLHIPRATVYDGVPFEEVSLGYPREWAPRGLPSPLLRTVLSDREAG